MSQPEAGPSQDPAGETLCKDLARDIIQASKVHQTGLADYIKRLTTEWHTLDTLIQSAEAVEYDSESESETVDVSVSGSQRAAGTFSLKSILRNEKSPLHRDALKLDTYTRLVTPQPMKKRELDTLAEAVRTENYRINAFEAEGRTQHDGVVDIDRNVVGLDWERITQKVLDKCQVIPRTSRDYEIRWTGDLHPNINHKEWDDEEIKGLQKIMSERDRNEPVDWMKIANELGTHRRPIDVMSKASPKTTPQWDAERERKLTEAVDIYGEDNWMLVARYIGEDVTGHYCNLRYNRQLKAEIKRRPWTVEHDRHLRDLVSVFGANDWATIAEFMEERTSEHCRERYESFPEEGSSKSENQKWTREEDIQLWGLVAEIGNRWREISRRMGNRAADKCRSRYQTLQRSGFDPKSEAFREGTLQVETRSRKHPTEKPGQDQFSVTLPSEPPRAQTSIPVDTQLPQASLKRGRGDLDTLNQNSQQIGQIESTSEVQVVARPQPRRITRASARVTAVSDAEPELSGEYNTPQPTRGQPKYAGRGNRKKVAQ